MSPFIMNSMKKEEIISLITNKVILIQVQEKLEDRIIS